MVAVQSRLRWPIWAPVVALVLSISAAAQAQSSDNPLIQGAIDKYMNADFQGVLQSLEEAEQSATLSLDDLGLLYEMRALVSFGLGNPEEMDVALRALAAARPEHAMTDMSPPALTERFAALRAEVQPPSAVVEGDDSLITARAEGDTLNLVRTVRLRVRAPGETMWRDIDEASPTYPVSEPTEAMAQLIGPGGVVIAESETQSFGVLSSSTRVPPALKWGLIGGAIGIAVIVVVAVMARRLGDRFVQPTAPECTGESCMPSM